MRIRKAKKKCPSCRQNMIKKGKGYICPDCGTRLVGNSLIRPKLRGDYWTRMWK